MQLTHPLAFIKGYLRDPRTVGSMLPSSQALAVAVCKHYRQFGRPAAVLEVGAGTGPITRQLGTILGDRDELDICELNDGFADIIARDVLTSEPFGPAVSEGRVRLIRAPVQDLTSRNRYDFVISGLPFTSFGVRDVRDVLEVVRHALKPGGVFSYYEYIGLRRATRSVALGKERKRIRQVSVYLSRSIARHQFEAETVFLNFPPAYARHWRFD